MENDTSTPEPESTVTPTNGNGNGEDNTMRNILIGVGLVAAIVVLVLLLGGLGGDDTDPGAAATETSDVAEVVPTDKPGEPTDEPKPTDEPAEPTDEPEEPTEAPPNRLDDILAAGKIVIGTSADYEPWEYKDEDDNFAGADRDIMREIAVRMGVEVEFQDLGFDTLIAAVETGKIDAVIAAMGATDDRREKVDFSVEYYFGKNAMVVMKDSDIEITDPLEAADYILGTQAGSLMADWVVDNLIEPGLIDEDDVKLYERADQVFLDLQAGRIQIGISDLDPAQGFLASEPNAAIVWTGPMDPNGQAIAIMLGEPELLAELDKHVSEMLADGFIDDVLEGYEIE